MFLNQTNGTRHRKKNMRAQGNGADILTQTDVENGSENTSLKCKSASTLLSGCRRAALAPAGRYLWAKSLKNKTLSVHRKKKTCRQTGGFEGPQPSAALRFEADWKLCFTGVNESERRKLWKAEDRWGTVAGSQLWACVAFFWCFKMQARVLCVFPAAPKVISEHCDSADYRCSVLAPYVYPQQHY